MPAFAIPGNFVAGVLVEMIGRKKTALIGGVLFVLCKFTVECDLEICTIYKKQCLSNELIVRIKYYHLCLQRFFVMFINALYFPKSRTYRYYKIVNIHVGVLFLSQESNHSVQLISAYMILIASYTATHVLIARALSGFGGSLSMIGGMVYMAEVMHPSNRERLGCVAGLLINAGKISIYSQL